MRNKSKGLITGVILGLGAGIVINKLLSEKSVDDVKSSFQSNCACFSNRVSDFKASFFSLA